MTEPAVLITNQLVYLVGSGKTASAQALMSNEIDKSHLVSVLHILIDISQEPDTRGHDYDLIIDQCITLVLGVIDGAIKDAFGVVSDGPF